MIVNGLANSIPINNIATGGVSDAYGNLFAPTGVTFSIWGVIYLLLAAHTLFQFGLFQKDRGKSRNELFRNIGVYFVISSIANILWIFSWHYYRISISLLLIVIILACLIKIADTIGKEQLLLKEKAFIGVPFSVYFGWITVATIANVAAFLVSIGWDGFSIPDQIWTVLVVLIGAAIGIMRMFQDRTIPYGLVFIWAYVVIWIKHTSPGGFAGQYSAIITTVIIAIILFIVAEAAVIYKRRNQNSSG